MNVRFSDAALRCRVTHGELEQLLGSGSLKLAVPLPRNHSFQVTLRSVVLGSWQLDSDPTGVWIGIPRTQIELLANALPSREGISNLFEFEDGKQLQLTLEVDVRKRNRVAVSQISQTTKVD